MRRAAHEATVLLTASTLLAGLGHYAISLLLMRMLPPERYTLCVAATSVLMAVGVLSTATVPAVMAGEVVATLPRSGARRAAVLACLRRAGALAAGSALVVYAAVASYADAALIAATAAGCALIWLNSVGAGYLQGEGRFGTLAALQLAETAARAAFAVTAVGVGWGAAGAVGSTAVGAAVAGAAGLLAARADLRVRVRVRDRPSGDGRKTSATAGSPPRTAYVALLQSLLCLLLTSDVVVATAVVGGSAVLAPYQALLVPARVPLHLATASAAVVFPGLAAQRPPPGRAMRAESEVFRDALRGHWTASGALTAVVVTCPRSVLALVMPAAYAHSSGLLLPLGLAGLAGATLTVTTVVCRAWRPGWAAVVLLACGCAATVCSALLTASHPAALAWSTAAATGTTAIAATALASRRVARLGPAAGAVLPLTAAALGACVLHALQGHPRAWCVAASVLLLAAGLRMRPRRRRPGPLRVLHLGFEAPYAPGAGGGSVRTHEVNRRMVARGVDVTVVCAPWPGCSAAVRDGVRYLPLPPRCGPLARHRFLYQPAYFPVITLGLGLLIRRTDPDVVVEDFAAPFSSVCVPYLTRRPVVGMVQWLGADEMSARHHLPFRLVESLGLRAHTRLLAVSRPLAEELRRRSPAAEVTVLHNGLDPAAFVRPDRRPREHVVYLGRLETRSKGLDLLLQAYAQVAETTPCDLWIAGDGPDEAAVRALADRLGIAHRIRWLGRVHGAARFELLASARLVCVPSRSETFGMVAAEALAAATPVLAFDIPCLRDLVTDRVGVRVRPGDTGAYARALTALAADPARCRTLGAAGPATVRHLDWDAVADGQLAVYRRAAGAPGQGGPSPVAFRVAGQHGGPA